MNRELRQRANESADRMRRAGMTLSAGIMQELIAEAERLGQENAAQADYIRFIEAELMQAQVGGTTALEQEQERGETKQGQELSLNHMVLAGEMDN